MTLSTLKSEILLKASSTHNLEVGYNNFSGKYKGSYYLFAKHSTNLIEPIESIEDGVTTTRYDNLRQNNSIGINSLNHLTI